MPESRLGLFVRWLGTVVVAVAVIVGVMTGVNALFRPDASWFVPVDVLVPMFWGGFWSIWALWRWG